MSRDKKHWVKLGSREIYKTPFFTFRSDQVQLPNDKKMPNYYVFDFVDWVNIVPITKDNRVVLIKQYRHAVEEVTLEIPGGAVDPRHGETPEQAAIRELSEETGYVPTRVELLGSHLPNPALQSNRLWSYVAFGCEEKLKQNLDEYEDIEVVLVPLADVMGLIKSGAIQHSLIIAALHLAGPYLEL